MSSLHSSSYPPLFRQTNHLSQPIDSDDSLRPMIDSESGDSDPIPIIDLQHLDLEKFGEACRDWGIFRLVNHEIPVALTNQLYDQAKELFNLPFESKQAKFTDPIAYFWGTPALTNKGVPLTHSVGNVNWVEGFHVLLGQLPLLPRVDPLLDSFRCLLEEYGKQMGRISRCIFKAMVMNLGMDPEVLGLYSSGPTGFMRVYRYPSCAEPNQVPGMAAHTDSSTLAILNQDVVGGLQVLKDNKWVDVKPVFDTLIINLGDMMQAISEDEYKSVQHKVKLNRCEERISFCYFVFPEEDRLIQSSKYKPFTYKEFRAQVQQDVKTTGFKVGLDRFRLDDPGQDYC